MPCMWKYIVVFWITVIGTGASTKNTIEFKDRKEAVEMYEYMKTENRMLITGLKLDSVKIK